jgi:hypothetical protein
MDLVKSKKRVADHGEVFTPNWVVQNMLDQVKDETERIDSRFLESACGEGNFLTAILERKFNEIQKRFGSSEFEKQHQALLALMCIYGIELLEDNVTVCRQRLFLLFVKYLKIQDDSPFFAAAKKILDVNILHADALTMMLQTSEPTPIVVPEWSYLGKGNYQRRDFRFDSLTQMSSFGTDTLFGDIGKHEIFVPVKDYPRLTVKDISYV